MALDFNVDPWYDDFDETKNYHRILFKPGKAVQARELTQAQTILQDQITKFADNIFKQNSPVTGGQVTTNLNCYYIKLEETYNDVSIDLGQWYNKSTNSGRLVRNADGSVVARVVQTVDPTGIAGVGDPSTLIVVYKSGGRFTDGDVIYDVDSSAAVQAISANSTGLSSLASISYGVFYVLGNFVQIQPQTIVVDKYDNTPTKRIGLQITETWKDYIDDASLLDPALGASNYQAPGADRYYISLELSTRPIQLGDDQNFVELVRITDGTIQKMVDGSVYNVIDEYFAKREYETNGDYIVKDFKLTPKSSSNTQNYIMSISKGLAYVHGYRVENTLPVELESSRSRTTETSGNNPVYVDYGNYFFVDGVKGANSSAFLVSQKQTVDVHCVPVANVETTTTAKYTSTLISSGYIRGLDFNSYVDEADANTYVYKAYVASMTNKSPTANATGGTSNTIALTSNFSQSDDAYKGVTISITNGPSAGDFRTISAYNGSTRTATVSQNWTTTPTSASVFTLNFDTKDAESLVSVDSSYSTNIPILAKSNINSSVGKVNGNAVMRNTKYPELLFNLGNPYVASLTDTSYTTEMVFTGVGFQPSGGGVTAAISFEDLSGIYGHLGAHGRPLSADEIKENFTIIVTNKGTNGTFGNGDIVEWVSANRTAEVSSDGSTITFTATTGINSFTATVIAKVAVINADSNYVRKYKKLVTANTATVKLDGTLCGEATYVDDSTNSTGQIYIPNTGVLGPGEPQSLYLSDVKRIVKIIDTKSPDTSPDTTILNDASYDVTSNYVLDNGQRDSFYDHASIKLKPGRPTPSGDLLVLVDYYKHYGGDGYFCVSSYTGSTSPEQYQEIPSYKASSGITYNLRDVVDFRPARVNAQVAFDFKYSGTAGAIVGLNLPVDLTTFTGDYTYYLGRKDKLILTKDNSFQILEGTPSITPLAPVESDGALVIANIKHDPYTGYIPTEAPAGVMPNLSVDRVQHKRYTMQDIANLEKRLNQVEYYSSLSSMEQKASALQISDAYGLNRFKNGILVDDFSSYAATDTNSVDFSANINRRERTMTALQVVNNYPLKSLGLLNSFNNLSTDLGCSISTDGYVNHFTLPYSTANVASQKFASRSVYVNPFSTTNKEGVLSLSPNVDNWVDNNYAPSLLITDPNLQVFQSSSGYNSLQAGDWKSVVGTNDTSSVTAQDYNNTAASTAGYSESTPGYQGTQTSVISSYSNNNNTYDLNKGYITDTSILPYIRKQDIVVKGKGLLFNATLNTSFDNTSVDKYFRKANIIELTGTTGSFKEGDVIGYYTNQIFTKTGRVVGVYQKTSTTVRLYVSADEGVTTYTTNGTIQNGLFDSTGTYVAGSSTASGTYSSTINYSGRLAAVNSTISLKLSNLASSTDNYYKDMTLYIVSGPGAGHYANIDTYVGSTRTAYVNTALYDLTTESVYSIGTIKSDETGSVYGVFTVPENTFHFGQRVFRIDDSSSNYGTSHTFAQGTFYAEGLQIAQQDMDFSAAPGSAKNTLSLSGNAKNVNSINPDYDPLAQTFVFDKTTYPNGLFLDSISLFFRNKPTSDNSPITLSVVGTLNGYPHGDTLDNSVVTLYPSEVVADTSYTEEPQYLDTRTRTTFKFTSPIYIQPGVLYAVVLKTNSKEYSLWTAFAGDDALKSSTKNLPGDATPQVATKIATSPYIGGLFLSQNSQTWSVDPNQSLMFVTDRCVFDTTAQPSIQYVVPKKLPERTLFGQSLIYANNANTISTTIDSVSNDDLYYDALNISTTDFVPTKTSINYTYTSSLSVGGQASAAPFNPGKFGTPSPKDIYLDDGNGQRMLVANSNSSLLVNARLVSNDNAVSPIISDSGLSAFTIKYEINNAELSNSSITVTNKGNTYNASYTTVTISSPTAVGGTTATATANVVNGQIHNIYITDPGSGYIETPTITIIDSSGDGDGNVAVTVSGETSKSGGNALSKYLTKKVTLAEGFDSGDLNVYLTAYRPVNTDINVYYKILSRNDTQKFEDGTWQLMTKISGTGSKYSSNRKDLYEYTFAPGTGGAEQGYVSYTSSTGTTHTDFNQFAIKVVMTTSDTTSVPVIYDLRAIALPSNVNTTI